MPKYPPAFQEQNVEDCRTSWRWGFVMDRLPHTYFRNIVLHVYLRTSYESQTFRVRGDAVVMQWCCCCGREDLTRPPASGFRLGNDTFAAGSRSGAWPPPVRAWMNSVEWVAGGDGRCCVTGLLEHRRPSQALRLERWRSEACDLDAQGSFLRDA